MNYTYDYTMDFELNGKHLIATDTEENLSNDELSLSIGAGGGFPNRIIKPKKAGTLTITGTIYRNGKFFRDVKKSYKVEGNTPSPTPVEGNTPSPAPVNKPTKPAKVTVKTTSYTIKKLKKKKTYYVRIRTYKKVSGKTYYSGWSSVKKVKIKK